MGSAHLGFGPPPGQTWRHWRRSGHRFLCAGTVLGPFPGIKGKVLDVNFVTGAILGRPPGLLHIYFCCPLSIGSLAYGISTRGPLAAGVNGEVVDINFCAQAHYLVHFLASRAKPLTPTLRTGAILGPPLGLLNIYFC